MLSLHQSKAIMNVVHWSANISDSGQETFTEVNELKFWGGSKGVIRYLWLCTCELTANLRYITIIYLWLMAGPDEIVSVRPVKNRASKRYSFPTSERVKY